MRYLYIAILTLIFLYAMVYIINVRIMFQYRRNGWDDSLFFSFGVLGGIIKLEYEIPLVDMGDKGLKFRKIKKENNLLIDEKENEKVFYRLVELVQKIESIREYYECNKEPICGVRSFLKDKMVLKDYRLEINVGSGDAFYAGISSGTAWALAGLLTSFLTNSFRVVCKNIQVKTVFNQKIFNVDLYCIFRIKSVHIILIALKMVLLNKKDKHKIKNTLGGDLVG